MVMKILMMIFQPNSLQLVVVYGVAMVNDISFGDDDDDDDG